MKKTNIPDSYLFVYGTLRNGFELPINKEIAQDVEYMGKLELKGQLYDIGEYPGATPAPDEQSKSRITGDLFRLYRPRKVLKMLDEYEGYDMHNLKESEYFRTKEMVETEDGKRLKVWVYWYNYPVAGKKQINYSDYLQYLQQKKSA